MQWHCTRAAASHSTLSHDDCASLPNLLTAAEAGTQVPCLLKSWSAAAQEWTYISLSSSHSPVEPYTIVSSGSLGQHDAR